MSLLNTKPRWAPNAIPSNRGWVDSVTGEVLIAIGNLKEILEKESATQQVTEKAPEKMIESTIQTVTDEVRVKRPYNKKAKLNEVVETSPLPKGVQIIGEVVEYDFDTKVIAE